MEPVRAEGSVVLASSAADVWPMLVDTDRTNRLLGMKPVHYEGVKDGTSGARLVGETILGGFSVRYEELPYEWVHERRFGVERRFHGGPLVRLSSRWTLERAGDGTKLTVSMEALPRVALLKPVAWFNLRRAVAGMLELGERIDRHLRERAPSPFAEPVSQSDERAVERAIAALASEHGVREEIAARLGAHVKRAPDADCLRIRPYEMADAWGADRREVLVAFLHAVSAGLVELRWSIVCPSCRTQAEAVPALEDIGEEGHCQMCDIAFELDLDRAVEATFTPAAAIRSVPPQMFCIAGPARTPHVLGQINVPHGGARALEAPSEAGRFRVFARGGARATLELVADGPDEVTLTLDDARLGPAQISARPSATLRFVNEGKETRHVKIERIEYASAAATAHELSTLPDFRRMFSRDLLKRGTPLKVARAAILFTDLTGSTALYTKLGDAVAVRVVDDHFDVLREAITRSNGVVIKTMGDAVMAAYVDERACVHGAIACLEAFERFRASREHATLTHIKLGLFAGPSYVVTANGALDYFGSTVNVASRLQHLAESGEIIAEEKAAHETDARCEASAPFDVRVKGIDQPLRVVRLRLRSAIAQAV